MSTLHEVGSVDFHARLGSGQAQRLALRAAALRRAHCRLMIQRVVNRENPSPNSTAQNADAKTKKPGLSAEKIPM